MFLGLGEAFSNLEYLQMFGYFTSLERRHFNFLGKLKKLILTDNSWLSSVTDDVFWDLWRLEELEITGSSLTVLPVSSLRTLKSLRKLTLIENKIKTLGANHFSKNCKLNILKVHEYLSFDIRIVPWNLPNLRSFDLSGNNISYLPQEFFKKMNKLEEIDLSGNRLSSLGGYFFKGLTDLKVLNLSSNPLESFPEGIFSDLVSLEKLNVSRCLLKYFPDQIFANLKQLTHIFASENELTRLEENLFENSENLKTIDFDSNKLQKINIFFRDFSSIEWLKFSDNVCINKTISRSNIDKPFLFEIFGLYVKCNENARDELSKMLSLVLAFTKSSLLRGEDDLV